MKELNTTELIEAIHNKKLIIDARPPADFVEGFVQGAINIVLKENFEKRATFYSQQDDFILIVSAEQKQQINDFDESFKQKISAVHYGTLQDWQQANVPLDLIINVDLYELKLDITHDEKAIVIDVRGEHEYEQEHIVGAVNMPANDFVDPAKISILDDKHNLYLHCNGGTSSVLVCSLLKKNGLHNIRNIEGGIRAVIADGNIPLKIDNKKNLN